VIGVWIDEAGSVTPIPVDHEDLPSLETHRR
jgi:hypothetical protein